jgi:hypothetical protein
LLFGLGGRFLSGCLKRLLQLARRFLDRQLRRFRGFLSLSRGRCLTLGLV